MSLWVAYYKTLSGPLIWSLALLILSLLFMLDKAIVLSKHFITDRPFELSIYEWRDRKALYLLYLLSTFKMFMVPAMFLRYTPHPIPTKKLWRNF